MNKFEKFTTLLTLAGLIVAVLAWIFPRSPTGNQLDVYDLSKISSLFTDGKLLLENQADSLTTNYEEKSAPKEKQFEPVITELTFHTFHQQLKRSGLDSGKIAFIRNSRRLLAQNMKFEEFLLALNTISLDDNKLEAVELLRAYIDGPTDHELELFGSQFSLSSNRRDAFNLLSKK